MARTVEEIGQEYAKLCNKAGNLHYQIKELSKDLDLISNTMRDLNLEAAAVIAADKKAKEAEEQAKLDKETPLQTTGLAKTE